MAKFEGSWKQVESHGLDEFLAAVQDHGMTACAWAGGDWWGDYPLSLQSRGGREVAPLSAILRGAPAAGR